MSAEDVGVIREWITQARRTARQAARVHEQTRGVRAARGVCAAVARDEADASPVPLPLLCLSPALCLSPTAVSLSSTAPVHRLPASGHTQATAEQAEFEFSKQQERFFKELNNSIRRAESAVSLLCLAAMLDLTVKAVTSDWVNAVPAALDIRAWWTMRSSLHSLNSKFVTIIETEGSDISVLLQAVGRDGKVRGRVRGCGAGAQPAGGARADGMCGARDDSLGGAGQRWSGMAVG